MPVLFCVLKWAWSVGFGNTMKDSPTGVSVRRGIFCTLVDTLGVADSFEIDCAQNVSSNPLWACWRGMVGHGGIAYASQNGGHMQKCVS